VRGAETHAWPVPVARPSALYHVERCPAALASRRADRPAADWKEIGEEPDVPHQ